MYRLFIGWLGFGVAFIERRVIKSSGCLVSVVLIHLLYSNPEAQFPCPFYHCLIQIRRYSR